MTPFAKLIKNIPHDIANQWSAFKVHMLKNYGENPGTMLVHTGTLGWILSSLAQIGAVVFNEEISPEQKSFLIPQEMADAAVNIMSFYLVTNSLKALGAKLVSTGKLRTSSIRKYLEKNDLMKKVGKLDFNIADTAEFGKISDNYKAFKNGVDVITSTTGSIISCNILTPIIRNQYASKRQKQTLSKMEQRKIHTINHPKGISIEDYQKLASMKFSHSSGLRV